MKKLSFIFTLFLFSISVIAQETEYFPAVIQSDLDGIRVNSSKFYEGGALWGIIDGGADLYLEYGFDRLLLQDVQWNSNKFRVEIYRMKDAAGALGVFSVSRFKCEKTNLFTKFICVSKYQIQSAIGKYYISVANESGSNQAMDQNYRLIGKLLWMTHEQPASLPTLFQKKQLEPFKDGVKYFRGKLGIQNGFPMWSDKFESFTNYEIFLLPVETENGYAYISELTFDSNVDLNKFIASNQSSASSGIKTYFKSINDKKTIYIESTIPQPELDKLID